jgi:hypothetical protein
MDIRRQAREAALGRAAKRTQPSPGDQVNAATWYGHRPMPPILRSAQPRPAGTAGAAPTR